MDHDDLLTHIHYIRAGVDGVNKRLDALNGKVNGHASDIAVLKDRTDRNVATSRSTSSKWGAGTGAAVGGAIIAIWQILSGQP